MQSTLNIGDGGNIRKSAHGASSLLLAALLALLFGAGCAEEISVATPGPVPDPVILRIDLAGELQPLRPAISACSAQVENTGVVVFEALEPDLPAGDGSVTLMLAALPEWEGAAFLLGYERIVIAGASGSPAASLTAEGLRSLFEGSPVSGSDVTAEVWVPVEGSEARFVLNAWMDGRPYGSENFLSPGPDVLAGLLAENPAAIGALPAAWLTDGLEVYLEIGELPVLAITNQTPEGKLREFLGCLQAQNSYAGP